MTLLIVLCLRALLITLKASPLCLSVCCIFFFICLCPVSFFSSASLFTFHFYLLAASFCLVHFIGSCSPLSLLPCLTPVESPCLLPSSTSISSSFTLSHFLPSLPFSTICSLLHYKHVDNFPHPPVFHGE